MIPDDIQPNLDDLPDYWAWSNGGRESLGLYATLHTPPDLIVGMASFFWPTFEIYRGGVFRRNEYSTFLVDHWYERLEGDIQAVERMVNFRHIADIFRDQCVGWSPTTIAFMGNVIRHTWAMALSVAFPNHEFAVSAEREDDAAEDVVVTFWQLRSR